MAPILAQPVVLLLTIAVLSGLLTTVHSVKNGVSKRYGPVLSRRSTAEREAFDAVMEEICPEWEADRRRRRARAQSALKKVTSLCSRKIKQRRIRDKAKIGRAFGKCVRTMRRRIRQRLFGRRRGERAFNCDITRNLRYYYTNRQFEVPAEQQAERIDTMKRVVVIKNVTRGCGAGCSRSVLQRGDFHYCDKDDVAACAALADGRPARSDNSTMKALHIFKCLVPALVVGRWCERGVNTYRGAVLKNENGWVPAAGDCDTYHLHACAAPCLHDWLNVTAVRDEQSGLKKEPKHLTALFVHLMEEQFRMRRLPRANRTMFGALDCAARCDEQLRTRCLREGRVGEADPLLAAVIHGNRSSRCNLDTTNLNFCVVKAFDDNSRTEGGRKFILTSDSQKLIGDVAVCYTSWRDGCDTEAWLVDDPRCPTLENARTLQIMHARTYGYVCKYFFAHNATKLVWDSTGAEWPWARACQTPCAALKAVRLRRRYWSYWAPLAADMLVQMCIADCVWRLTAQFGCRDEFNKGYAAVHQAQLDYLFRHHTRFRIATHVLVADVLPDFVVKLSVWWRTKLGWPLVWPIIHEPLWNNGSTVPWPDPGKVLSSTAAPARPL